MTTNGAQGRSQGDMTTNGAQGRSQGDMGNGDHDN